MIDPGVAATSVESTVTPVIVQGTPTSKKPLRPGEIDPAPVNHNPERARVRRTTRPGGPAGPAAPLP